jgi:hypothetical protein
VICRQAANTILQRPDLDAPRWDVKVYNEDALAPGYWFLSPYGIVAQIDNNKAYVGPHIYDSKGELVWSGAPSFDGWDVFDFKVSNVGGKDMLTGLHPHENRGFIINNKYENHAEVDTGITKVTMNMHDFEIVDNGTRALYLNKDRKEISVENSLAVGFDGHCKAEFTGFQERDLKTGDITFTWSPENRIGLDESTMRTPHIENACTGEAWDYL